MQICINDSKDLLVSDIVCSTSETNCEVTMMLRANNEQHAIRAALMLIIYLFADKCQVVDIVNCKYLF